MQWVFILIGAVAFASQIESEPILGIWLIDDDGTRLEIFRCGDDYCGRIVDLKEKVYSQDDARGMAGQPKVDRDNSNIKLRQRPIIGLVIMQGFKPEPNGWRTGTFYNPDLGKTYRCMMRLIDDGHKLYVRSFVGKSPLARTTYWRRPD